MVNPDLRSALIAKTALRDNNVTKEGLILTAIEEALTLKNGENVGHRNKKVIFARSIKIFKNLLKQYKIKSLIEKFCDLNTMVMYQKRNHIKLSSQSQKNKIIESIVLSSCYTINTIIIKRI